MKWTIKGVWNHQAGNLLQPLQKYSKEEIKTHWRLGKWNITGKSGICAWLGGKFGPQQRRFFHSHCCKSQTPIIDSNFTIPSESLVVIQSGSKHAIVCYVGICQDSVLYPTFGWWKSWSKRSSTLGLKKTYQTLWHGWLKIGHPNFNQSSMVHGSSSSLLSLPFSLLLLQKLLSRHVPCAQAAPWGDLSSFLPPSAIPWRAWRAQGLVNVLLFHIGGDMISNRYFFKWCSTKSPSHGTFTKPWCWFFKSRVLGWQRPIRWLVQYPGENHQPTWFFSIAQFGFK